MATTLTTQWQNVAYRRYTTGGGSVIDFYLDARYTSQSTSPASTNVETKLRSVKVTSATVGGSGYNFTLTYSAGTSGSGVWYFSTTDICTGSANVPHNADGTKTVTLSASVTNNYLGISFSFSGDATLPTIITKPSLSITGAGTSSNHLVMSANTNTTVSVTNTQGRSTSIKLDVTNSSGTLLHTYSLGTVTSDTSSKTVTIPIELWDYITDNDYSGARCKIYATNTGGESRSVIYLELASSQKPTISSVVLSGTNPSSASTLGSNLVKGITIPIITTTVSSSGLSHSSPIVRYELRAFTGYDGALPKDITQVFNGTKPYNASSVTATVRVYDARGHYADKTSSAVSVIDYSFPSLTCSVKRAKKSGSTYTLDEDGTWGKLFIDIAVSPIHIGSADKNTKTLQYSLNNGISWTTISTSSYTQHIELGIGSGTTTGPFLVTDTYDVWVRIKDLVNETTTKLQIVPSFTTISLHSGGKGVSVGRVATADELQVYMQTHINNGLYIGNTLVLYDDGN